MKKLCALFISAVMSVSLLTGSFSSVFAESSTEINDSANDKLASSSRIPAFPGAEGGGKYATGGRGGKVYHVTNLNDSGPGSFRDAVSGSNRIVVFDVGGTIELKSDVVVKGNITIAGQTAPGGAGVTLKNYKLGMGGDNIIIRFISSRPGERKTTADYDAWGGANGSKSIVDHCSLGWANDEQWGLYSNNMYQTVQWSLIGPANSFSYHSKGIHGFGIMFGKGQCSWHHNMMAHNISRNFRGKVEGTSVMDYVNNVIYDWGYETAYGTMGHLNYVNNYYKGGNSTSGSYRYINFSSGSNIEKYKFFLQGNKMILKDKDTGNYRVHNSETDDDWSLVNYNSAAEGLGGETYYRTNSYMPLKDWEGEDVSVVKDMSKVDSADEAYEKVLKYAGSGINAQSRPPIDAQVMEEAENGTGYVSGARPKSDANVSQQAEIKKNSILCGVDYKYPEKITENNIKDSDNDGMPDDWEIARGLDPNKNDSTGDYCGLGYTNIEYYINDLTIDAFPEGTVTMSPILSVDINVDPSADEVVENGNISFKTIAKAIEYIEANDSDNLKGSQNIYIAPGNYDEDITINNDNVIIMPKKNTTGDVVIKSLNLGENAENFLADGITFGKSDASGVPLSILADKTIFTNCKVVSSKTAISMPNDTRAFFKNCNISSAETIVQSKARAIFDSCTLKSSSGGNEPIISEVNLSDGNGYGLMFINSNIIGDSGVSNVKLGKGNKTSSIIYYKCSIDSSVGTKENRWASAVSENIRFLESATKDITDLNSIAMEGTYISETDLLEKYLPYNHLNAKFNAAADDWNPGGYDTITPKQRFEVEANKLTVTNNVITENLKLPTSLDGVEDSSIKWEANNNDRFSNNTLIVGEIGQGVAEVKLKATISKAGLKDIIKEFTVYVGSITEDSVNTVTFTDEEIGKPSNYISIGKEQSATFKWGVTDNIDGTKFENHGNFYGIEQTATTPDTYSFAYNFKEPQSEKVFEVSFDVYTSDITEGGYFETYVRGGSTVGQIRHTIDSLEAYNGSKRNNLGSAGGRWVRIKILVNTIGITTGTAPKVDYFIYDEDGNLLKSQTGSDSSTAYNAAEYEKFIPNRLEFRPNRNFDKCKFYIDNILFKDYTQIAQSDADVLSEKTVLNMSNGDSLPKYGAHVSNVTWSVKDGSSELVNKDGTINYSKCKEAVVKVVGNVTYSTENKGAKASALTNVITLNITGTGNSNPEVPEKFFNDIDDFSKWNIEYNQASYINKAHTADIGGNNSTKIELKNKAVFRTLESPVYEGKVEFNADVYIDKTSVPVKEGRQFRIFLESAGTETKDGMATAVFDNSSIFYHIADIGDKAHIIKTDNSSETNSANGTEVCTMDGGKWYRIKIIADIDTGISKTSIYMHGNDGKYNPDNISDTAVGTVEQEFISKSPLELKQIRLVRTAGSNVYFDNISIKEDTSISAGGITLNKTELNMKVGESYTLTATVSPENTPNKNVIWSIDKPEIAKVENGVVTALSAGTATVTAKSESGNYKAQCKLNITTDGLLYGDADGNGIVDFDDAAIILQYVLDGDEKNFGEKGLESSNVTNSGKITAADAASVLMKALNGDNFKFEVENKNN